jgi:uncharacterized protein (DUF58 family)
MLMLVLAADTFDFAWTRYREDLFELAVTALGSLAWRALEDGWQVGLLANTLEPVRLASSSANGQLTEILEALAKVEPRSQVNVDQLLAARSRSRRDLTYVLATGRATPPLNETLERLRAAGRTTVVLYGDDPPVTSGPLSVYRLRQWDDLATTLEGPGEVSGGR